MPTTLTKLPTRTRRKPPKRVTPTLARQIRRAHAKGDTWATLTKHFQLSTSTIARILREGGAKSPPPSLPFCTTCGTPQGKGWAYCGGCGRAKGKS